jgi:hypothetical protein
MPDGPFKGMTRDKDSLRRPAPEDHDTEWPCVQCEKCGGWIFEGSWPWCKGDPRQHER